MNSLLYKPNNAWTGDFIPYYENGVFHLFYLHSWRDPAKNGIPWYQISTEDFVHFDEHGEMLKAGGLKEQDLCVFTGSVFKKDNKYHIFYTGHNPGMHEKGLPAQGIMHAVSDDLLTFTKIPEDTFYTDESLFERDDFRDPFVYFYNDKYYMLLVAKKKDAPTATSGVTAVYCSLDLINWKYHSILWDPQLYHTHECPDLFKMGDWWYLIYSEYSDKRLTRYRMSRDINGPWHRPYDDSFDTTAYYAAKSAFDGTNRYLFGWGSTKSENNDSLNWEWGG